MADEQEGAQGGNFKKEVEQQQIVGQYQRIHGADEQKQQGEKSGLSGFGQFQVVLVMFHIGQGVKNNQRACNGYQKNHDQGEVVTEETGRCAVAVEDKEFENGEHDHLNQGQDRNNPVFEFYPEVEDQAQQGKICNLDEGCKFCAG